MPTSVSESQRPTLRWSHTFRGQKRGQPLPLSSPRMWPQGFLCLQSPQNRDSRQSLEVDSGVGPPTISKMPSFVSSWMHFQTQNQAFPWFRRPTRDDQHPKKLHQKNYTKKITP